MSYYSMLDRVAATQIGFVTTGQLREVGVTRSHERTLIARGLLARERHGVYRLCGVAPTWVGVAMGAVLAAGPASALSHRSAAILWGLIDHSSEEGPLEITSSRRHRLKGVVVHRHDLPLDEITTRDRVPVTTPERTLLDLAESIEDERGLGRLCDEALRRRLCTVGRLHAVVQRHGGPGRRRLGPIHAVLADRIPGYDPGANDWELQMDRMWDRLGLPPAERQFRVRAGRRTYKVDRAIVDLKIAVEWNGYDPHGYRSNVDRDSDRRAELAAAGWYVLEFTAKSRPELICRAVLAVVADRRTRTAAV
jgi:Transcriptional regulator, AbiEi antitoxin/AbiEi antitoxin C-terminal domain